MTIHQQLKQAESGLKSLEHFIAQSGNKRFDNLIAQGKMHVHLGNISGAQACVRLIVKHFILKAQKQLNNNSRGK